MTENEALAIEEHLNDLALITQFTIQGWGETKRKITNKNTHKVYFEL